jgi:hypothetical protein
MVTMPDSQLESMYPDMYYRMYPEVVRECDRMEMVYGEEYMPGREELDKMMDNIFVKLNVDIDISTGSLQASADSIETQVYGGRGILRDLAGILLIRELLGRRRRRRPYFPYGYGYDFGRFY